MADEVRKFCRLGAQHLDRGEPEEALQWFDRALEVDPEDPDAWCGYGKSCYELGRLERAERGYRKALRFARRRIEKSRRPHRWWTDDATRPYLRALHGRGLCRFWQGAYDDAARLFHRLLSLAPTDPLDSRFLLGEAYFRIGELDRATREWQTVGDDPDALYNLGLAYFFRGEFTRSVNAFRRGIFENLFLVSRLTNSGVVQDVPTYGGTHYKGLDHENAALDYLDRCGDLWRGRPLLCRWLRGIYEHEAVRADLQRHVAHLRTLQRETLSPGDRARLEGENTALRNAARLADTDLTIASDLLESIFRAGS